MKKRFTHIICMLMVFIMAFNFTACGSVELESKTIKGVTLNIPSDFGEFKESDGISTATDEDSTCAIVISEKGDAQGIKPTDYEEDTYEQAYMGTYTDTSFVKFDNKAKIDGNPTLFAQFKGTNSKNVKLVVYSYIIFFDDGNCQSISFSYADKRDTSLEENIDSITKSIKIA